MSFFSKSHSRPILIGIFALSLTSISHINAANYVWEGGTSSDLATNTNWNPTAVPGTNDTGEFTSSGNLAPTLSSSNLSVGTFEFIDNAAYVFTITGNGGITFYESGVVSTTTGTQVFNASNITGLAMGFLDSASAGAATYNLSDAELYFYESSTSDAATFNLQNNAFIEFANSSQLGSATFNLNHSQVDIVENSGLQPPIYSTSSFTLTNNSRLQPSSDTPSITIGSLSGDSTSQVALGSPFVIGSNNLSTTFAGVINDQGGTSFTLTKIGTGTLTLSGANILAQTYIQEGTLSLPAPGSLSGNLEVKSGATSNGDGTVRGNYLQDSGSFFLVNAPGVLTVLGNATLNGGEVEVANITLPLNTPIPILHSEMTLSGAYNGLNSSIPDVFAYLTYNYTTGFVFLNLASQLLTTNLTSNETSVTQGLQSIYPNPSSADQSILLTSLLSLQGNDYLNALNQMSGVQYANLIQSSQLSNRRFLKELFNHYRFDFAPLSYVQLCRQWTFWSTIQAGESFLNHDENAQGWKLYDVSYTIGGFRDFASLQLGGAINYEYDHACFNEKGTGNSQIVQGALTGIYERPAAYLFGAIVGGYNQWRIARDLDFDSFLATAKGKTEITHLCAYGEAGYNLLLCSPLLFQPFCGIEYGQYWRSRVTESGAAAANLTVESQNKNDLESRLGARLYLTYSRFILSVDADWRYRFIGLSDKIPVRFETFGDAFPIWGPKQRRNGFEGTLFATTPFICRSLFYLEASGEVWRGFANYSISLGVEKGW